MSSSKKSSDISATLREVVELLRELQEKISNVEEDIAKIVDALNDLKKRVTKIERYLASTASIRGTTAKRQVPTTSSYAQELIRYIKDRVFVETREIKARKTLKRLIDEGKVILLKDDVLNLEVVTTRDVVKKILKKLPVPVDKVDEVFDEREYELLKILNRLGYVLIRDNMYVKTELANELVQESGSSEEVKEEGEE